jgi:hypothetical protein
LLSILFLRIHFFWYEQKKWLENPWGDCLLH